MTTVNGTASARAAIRNYGRIEMENTCEKKQVGGRIFFIDSESTEEVEFFDIRGRKVNPKVGSMPYSYRVTKEGDRPKFWVFNSRMGTWKRWIPYNARYTCLATLEKFGSGAENTEKAIEAFGIVYEKDQDTNSSRQTRGRISSLTHSISLGCGPRQSPRAPTPGSGITTLRHGTATSSSAATRSVA